MGFDRSWQYMLTPVVTGSISAPVRSKTPLHLMRRATNLILRYGLSSRNLEHRLDEFHQATRQLGKAVTLPLPAGVLARNPDKARELPSPRPRFLPAAPTDDVLRRKLWLLTQQLLRHGINHHDQHHHRRHPKRHADPGRRPDRGGQVNVTQVDRREADHWQ